MDNENELEYDMKLEREASITGFYKLESVSLGQAQWLLPVILALYCF